MKKLGIAAIVCAVIFLAFAVIGGICLGVGIANVAVGSNFTEIVQNYSDDIYSILEGTQNYAWFTGSESCEISPDLEAVELVGFTGNVTVRPYASTVKDYTVLIEYDNIIDLPSSVDQHFKFTDDGHTLTISPANDIGLSGNIGIVNIPTTGDITIYLPQYNEFSIPIELDLTISDTVGEIYVGGYTFGNVTLSNTVGEITLEDITANVITCEDTVGEIDADGKFAGISITDTIGECDIESDTPLTVDSQIEGNIAEVHVSIPSASRLNFTTADALGTIRIDDVLRDNSSSVSFDISGSMGNVVIEAD